MQIPSSLVSFRRFSIGLTLAVLVFITGAVTISAQKTEANPSVTLEQCRNGSAANPVGCVSATGSTGWVTGNTGSSNSHWAEDQFLPYRALLLNMPTTPGNSNTLVIGYDVFHSGVHAIDYLGTYNATEATANPCVGVNPSPCGGVPSTFPVPIETEPTLVNPVVQTLGEFTLWGGTITNVSYLPYAGGDERLISVTFESNVANPVLSWGGHVAWQGHWGAGNSAGGISGSPYHMRVKTLNGASTGNQDRSLSADAVAIPAKLTIVKDANVSAFPNVDPSEIPFDFTASPLFGFPSFTLFDGPTIDPGADTQVGNPILLFGPDNAITVTEALPPTGWTLGQISCVGSGIFTPQTNIGTRTAIVTLQEGAIVTCTFTNFLLGPSAAPASVNGRVSTAEGRGIGGAVITIFNATTGESTVTVSNSFGYYSLQDLPVSDFYVMTVMHKRYMFLDASRSFTLEDDMFNVNFTASQME